MLKLITIEVRGEIPKKIKASLFQTIAHSDSQLKQVNGFAVVEVEKDLHLIYVEGIA